MNKVLLLPILMLWMVLIPAIGVFLYIAFICFYYAGNQTKIHNYIMYGYTEGFNAPERLEMCRTMEVTTIVKGLDKQRYKQYEYANPEKLI